MANNDFPLLSESARKSIQQRTDTRAMHTLLGICSGICADEQIDNKEISYLRTWLVENPETTTKWPGSTIAQRINEIMADGIVTSDERASLLALLQELTGNFFSDTGAAAPEGPALPIDDDPSIFFKHMTFCFTGDFMYGTRAACERVILNMGGMALDNVTKKLNYLVIGSMISPAWAHTTFGRKIQKAVEYRDRGDEICIVSERQWAEAIADVARRH